ncbi:POK9 protein, partial [Struthidea cinerea]|nr:POK9 protein [Struthidea cinerea]
QLRNTVNESGLHSEPAQQMLNFVWRSGLLCPADIKGIMTRHNTKPLPPCQPATDLRPATRGSLGLDLATSVDVTLVDRRPTKLGTGLHGPLIINGRPQGALLLGRSSSSIWGLFILPGIIDADYHGEIMIMAQTDFPPIYIPAGSKIAQLVPLPQLTTGLTPLIDQQRGSQGFGSTGPLALLTVPLSRRPVVTATFTLNKDSVTFQVLLDTGADVTIVCTSAWPQHWPCKPTTDGVEGVGGAVHAKRS